MARILGEREFWGLPFRLSPDTLVPRPDTETVVERPSSLIPDRRPVPHRRFRDRNGVHPRRPAAREAERPGLGIDRSLGALGRRGATPASTEWASAHGFAAANWADSLTGPFDLIVSNPPYIATCVVDTLDRDVREHDPHLALDGGPDGLDAYRALLGDAARLLSPGGRLVLEIGYDQAEAFRTWPRRVALKSLPSPTIYQVTPGASP